MSKIQNRKQFWKRSLLALPLLAATACYGDVISLASLGTAADPGQTNDWGGLGTQTIVISKNPGWANALSGSQWVSFGDTGVHDANFFTVPNGTLVDFTDVFNVSGAPIAGSITVMADDTTSIWLNGVELLQPASTEGNTFRTCSDFATGCLTSTASTINLLPALRTGSNTLTFGVQQIAGDSFGLDYAGSVTSGTPEPATMGLLGLGLAAISLAGRKLARKR